MAGDRYTAVRMGDDPFGRDEPTVFYRDADHPERGQCYVWLKLLSESERHCLGLTIAADDSSTTEPAPESERFLCPRCGEYHEDEARCSNCGRHS